MPQKRRKQARSVAGRAKSRKPVRPSPQSFQLTDPYVLKGLRYAQDVVSGAIDVCKFVKLACKRHLNDLKRHGLDPKGRTAFYFDESEAGDWCLFAEQLPHIKGPLSGQNIHLEAWQCWVLTAAFGWYKRSNRMRRFRRTYIEVPRGNAKSTLTSTVCLKALAADGEGGAEVYCLAPETKVLCGDFKWRQIGTLSVGDSLIAFDEKAPAGETYRKLRPAAVTSSTRIVRPSYRLTFDDGRQVIASAEHLWLGQTAATAKRLMWMRTNSLRPGAMVRSMGVPWETEDSYDSGYLAGVFDGEACFHKSANPKSRDGFRISFAQRPGAVMQKTRELCEKRGFRLSSDRKHKSGCDSFEIPGFYGCARFLGQVRPVRLLNSATAWYAGRAPNRGDDKNAFLKSIEYIGDTEVVALGTTTGTLFANGLFSHNSAATNRDQARIVFADGQNMARRRPDLCGDLGIEVLAHAVVQPSTASKFTALASDSNGLDGLNIHLAAVDELHAHRTREVYDVLETGAGKRLQSMLWTITTAGSDRAGICYEVRTYATKVLQGVIEDDSLFAVIYTIDDDDNWTDERVWRKANPNWGISVQPDIIAQLAAKAMQMPAAQSNFKTKHLNVWVNADQAWMNMLAWERCANRELKVEQFAGEEAWIGLDLASKVDIAARYVIFRREIAGVTHYYGFGRFFLPEDAVTDGRNSQYGGWAISELLVTTPGDVLDFQAIEDDLTELSTAVQVREVGYDPWQATQLAQRMQGQGATMIECRNTVAMFSAPMKELDALVRSGRFHHDGNPIMTWMVSNVVCHLDAKENIYPRKERPENKIDGVIAAITALSRAMCTESNLVTFEGLTSV